MGGRKHFIRASPKGDKVDRFHLPCVSVLRFVARSLFKIKKELASDNAEKRWAANTIHNQFQDESVRIFIPNHVEDGASRSAVAR